MAEQYLAFVEETVRGTDPGSGYLFLPVMSTLQPTTNFDDQPRKEFKGQDTALGDASVVRRSGQWTMTIECAYYPGAEVGLLLKHALGKSETRVVEDISAFKGILYPLAEPYGIGNELAQKAIGIIANTDEGGTTKAQYFGGGRIKSANLKGEGTDDVKWIFEIQGAAEHIGPVDQTATAGVTFPVAAPFSTNDCLLYIGAGITRTGTAPVFTDLAPNTMNPFQPDNFDITITNGLNDKNVFDGLLGPNKTFRESQVAVTVTTPIDYEDPASGFSSADQFKLTFDGPQTSSILLVMDNGELAGAAASNYETIVDLANLLVVPETPERSSEGLQPTVNFTFNSLYDATAKYPVAIFTTDQATAY